MSSKIKDGLFMGDLEAAQDAEFLQLNGIVHIINCVPRQVPNIFQQSLSISYVACELDEVLKRPFFDLKNREFMHIVHTIDTALEKTESVLVHSLNGIARSPSLMIGYMMVRYCWGVDKAFDFVSTKRADIKPHDSYVEQLCTLEAQMQAAYPARATEAQLYEWNPLAADVKTDEVVLVHTFLNCSTKSNVASEVVPRKPSLAGPPARRVSWIDQNVQMKKMHPSLLLKPERPPGHSYNDMLPSDGWVDTANPTLARASIDPRKSISDNKETLAALRERVLFTDLSNVQGGVGLPVDQDAGSPESPPDNARMVGKMGRMHSFSLPKKKATPVDSENQQMSLSPLSPSEQDDPDFASDSYLSKQSQSSSQPRYLQDTRSSMNSRPRKPLTRPGVYRMPTVPNTAPGGSSSKLTAPAANPPARKASTTRDSEEVKNLSRLQPQTIKPTRVGSAKAMSSRSLFATELPPQISKTIGMPNSSRANPIGDMDPSISMSTTSSRPRTAPSRTNRREVDTADLLQTKKVEFAGASQSVGINRVVLEAPATRRMSGSVDFATTTAANARGGRLGGLGSSARFATRPRQPSRAQWK